MIRRPTALRPLPESFATTVGAVHALAEHVLCVPRFAMVGRVGLVAAHDGIETPYWNASFGAALPYDAVGSLDEAIAFLVRGYRLVGG